MENNRKDAEKDAQKSLGERFREHMKTTAHGPKGFASIMNELKFALTDIRHKVVEEATYGRAVTPHWRDVATTPQAAGGIHGKADTPGQNVGGSVHGTSDAPKPDAGGIHGKAESEPKDKGPAGPGMQATAEPKGLGMSYAELTAGWEKACAPGQEAGRERERPKEQEQTVER